MLQADQSTSPSPTKYLTSSVQTEWLGDYLQDYLRDLKSEQERRKRERKEFKVSEARLQVELAKRQDRLHETELKLQKAEATLLERENALQELRNCLEVVSEDLKATEEAHALKDVCLEKQLCLLQESQERERKCLNDSLHHAEKRGRELEERLKQTEVELQKLATESTAGANKRFQELQHQLDESDSELNRLRARLRNEESLYYDLEHNYERVCEELECARGTLKNYERVSEEHLKDQLNQRQQELNKKEQELQEVLSKMSQIPKREQATEGPTNSQGVGSGWDIQQGVIINKDSSYGSEEWYQQSTGNLRSIPRSTEQLMPNTLFNDTDVIYQDQPLQSHQEFMLKSVAPNLVAYNGILDFDLLDDLQEDEKSLEEQLSPEMLSKILSLEGMILHKMASALETPSQEFLHRLLELQVLPQALGEELIARNYSELLASEADCPLGEREICNLCVKAELAYLTCTDLQSRQEPLKSEASRLPSQRSLIQMNTKLIESSKMEPGLENLMLPELVPYHERNPDDMMTLCPEDMESLALHMRAHARSLQTLSVQLQTQNESLNSHPEDTPDVLRAVFSQATLVYVTTRLRLALQHHLNIMQACLEQAVGKYNSLETQFKNQEEHYTEKMREHRVTIEMADLARESAETSSQIKEQEMQHLKEDFENKLEQIQQIHTEEMTRVRKYYTRNRALVSPSASDDEETPCVNTLKPRIKELEMQVQGLEEEIRRRDAKRQAYERELETLKVPLIPSILSK